MKKEFLSLIVLLLSISSVTIAQFSVSAEYRVRGEANHGYKTLAIKSSETSFYVTQRTRLNLNYKAPKYIAYFSLQDVRFWGQEDIVSKTGVNYSSIGVDISQAWFDWKFAENLGLKTGRQIWNYDDGRIVARRNWNQTSLSWDAFLLHFEKDKFKAHFGSSINNTYWGFDIENFEPEDNPFEEPLGYRIKYFNFLWLNFKLSSSFNLSIANYYASFLAPESKSIYYSMGTSGVFLEFKKGGLLVNSNLFYQYGKTAIGQNKSAYLITLNVNYSNEKYNIGFGSDFLSGNQSNSDNYNAFDQLYGARFKFNGWMNYYIIPANTKHGGLVDIYPNFNYKFTKKHSIYATYHFFSLATMTFDSNIGGSYLKKNLGGELDLSYTYKFDKNLNIKAHFGYYFATETTEYVKGIEPGKSTSPFWASVMLTFKPTLFTTKGK